MFKGRQLLQPFFFSEERFFLWNRKAFEVTEILGQHRLKNVCKYARNFCVQLLRLYCMVVLFSCSASSEVMTRYELPSDLSSSLWSIFNTKNKMKKQNKTKSLDLLRNNVLNILSSMSPLYTPNFSIWLLELIYCDHGGKWDLPPWCDRMLNGNSAFWVIIHQWREINFS